MQPPTLRFDSYGSVQEALRAGAGRVAVAAQGSLEAQRAPRLAVVLFADEWAPPALATAAALEAVRSGGDVQGFAQLFLVDASEERDHTWEAGVVTTPALTFYWDGEPVLVTRPDWEDDYKYCGAMSIDRLLEIVRHARDCCKERAEGAQLTLTLDD